MAETTTIIKYSMADTAGVVGQNPFKQKARLDDLTDWTFTDKLNKLQEYRWTVAKNEYTQANSFVERKVFVPFLTPFRGMVVDFAEDETSIEMIAKEFATHLERRIFQNDGEKRITYTNENWFNTSWLHRQKFFVKKDKIADEIKRFPLLLDLGANTTFANHAQADGDDFVFTEKDGTTVIPHEIENYDSATGTLRAWVRLPKVSDSAKAEFYVYYDNAGAANQEDIVNVWKNLYRNETGTAVTDFAYNMVQHLDSDSVDSTENNNDGTDTAISYTQGDIIGNAAGFDGVDSKIDCGSAANIDGVFGATSGGWLSVYFNANSDGESDESDIVSKGDDSTLGWHLEVNQESSGFMKLHFNHHFSSTHGEWETTNAVIAINTDYRVDVLYDNGSASNDPTIYINGVAYTVGNGLTELTTPSGTAQTDAAQNLIIGNIAAQTNTFDGEIDEVRIMKTPPADTEDIIKTEYNIINDNTGCIVKLPHEEYQKGANLIAQDILDSANTDQPAGVTWQLGEDFPTDVITVGFKHKNHWQCLNEVAIILQKDLFFDNEKHKVYIATKGKAINDKLDLVLTTKPEKKTDNFANILDIIGEGKEDDNQLQQTLTSSTVLRYNYEKTISDSSLSTSEQVTNVGNSLLSEFQKLTPSVKGSVPLDQFLRFNLRSGDTIKIIQPQKNLTETFRVMEIKASKKNVKLVLESTATGIVRNRSLSLSDVIEGILKMSEDTNMESS